MTKPIIEINDLCFTRSALDIVHHINLSVYPGDFIAIIGPNGGGKTTLLKLILGLLAPSRGQIRVNGSDPREHCSNIGYVPQYVNSNRSFPATVLDVVLMGISRKNQSKWAFSEKKRNIELAHYSLDKIGAGHLAARKIASLSGGQRQRVLIARALAAEPELLILDEPTASIDTKGQTEFYELLQRLNDELTIVMVSHDLMIVSSYVKSIVCLNRKMHYHQSFKDSSEVLEAFYSCSAEETCPVGLVQQKFHLHEKERKHD